MVSAINQLFWREFEFNELRGGRFSVERLVATHDEAVRLRVLHLPRVIHICVGTHCYFWFSKDLYSSRSQTPSSVRDFSQRSKDFKER